MLTVLDLKIIKPDMLEGYVAGELVLRWKLRGGSFQTITTTDTDTSTITGVLNSEFGIWLDPQVYIATERRLDMSQPGLTRKPLARPTPPEMLRVEHLDSEVRVGYAWASPSLEVSFPPQLNLVRDQRQAGFRWTGSGVFQVRSSANFSVTEGSPSQSVVSVIWPAPETRLGNAVQSATNGSQAIQSQILQLETTYLERHQ
jgi:hypothetical protein